MKQQILVIDDERDLCEILRFNLTAAGFEVHTAYSGEDALQQGITNYDLLLLDVMMPHMSGFELAKRLKQDPDTAAVPIIFLTAPSSVQELRHEGLVMDLTKMTVTVDGQPVLLTKTEFEILKVFLANQGQVFSRQELLDKVWPRDVVVTDRTVDVNITRMRKKIGRYSSCIVTRHGFGYLFVV